MPEEKQAALDAGMNEFMNKPIELTQLITQIANFRGFEQKNGKQLPDYVGI